MAAMEATGFRTQRQHDGNRDGVFSSQTTAADLASSLAPVAESVAENKVHGLVADGIGLPGPYPPPRHKSNP